MWPHRSTTAIFLETCLFPESSASGGFAANPQFASLPKMRVERLGHVKKRMRHRQYQRPQRHHHVGGGHLHQTPCHHLNCLTRQESLHLHPETSLSLNLSWIRSCSTSRAMTQGRFLIFRIGLIHRIASAHLRTQIRPSTHTLANGSPNITGRAHTISSMQSYVIATCCSAVPGSRTTSSARGNNGMSTGVQGAWCACCRRHTVKSIGSGLGKLFTRRTGGSDRQAGDFTICQASASHSYIGTSLPSQHSSRHSRYHVLLHIYFIYYTSVSTYPGRVLHRRTVSEAAHSANAFGGTYHGKDGGDWHMEVMHTIREKVALCCLQKSKGPRV